MFQYYIKNSVVKMLIEKQGDITIIAPRKSVDVSTAPELEQFVVSQLDNGARKIIMDLSQVDYISSVGLRVMLLTAKKLKKARRRGYLLRSN